MTALALIGLGSNLGDRKELLDAALAALAAAPGLTLRSVSPYHETAPAGGPPGQGPFLNAAAAIETSHDPFTFLHFLQEVEHQAGRVRVVRWGERTLDLDLLLYNDRILDTPELVVPHPRMPVRRFVLGPAAEVAPEMVDPLTGWTISALLSNLDRRPSYVALDGPGNSDRSAIIRDLVARLDALGLSDPAPSTPQGTASDPLAHQLDSLLARARVLSCDRWSPDRLGERWLVTGFCLARDLRRVKVALGARILEDRGIRDERLADLDRRLREAEAAIGRAVCPTFAVVLDPSRGPEGPPEPLSIPLLRPESEDRAAVAAEILAACAASRGG